VSVLKAAERDREPAASIDEEHEGDAEDARVERPERPGEHAHPCASLTASAAITARIPDVTL
jgi:hypothetical protein